MKERILASKLPTGTRVKNTATGATGTYSGIGSWHGIRWAFVRWDSQKVGMFRIGFFNKNFVRENSRATRRCNTRIQIGARVSAINVKDALSSRVLKGVFSVTQVYPNGDAQIRKADGTFYRVPMSHLRSAKNALAPGQTVPVHSITYLDKKSDDKKAVPYEHEFEGNQKPKLYYDGKNLHLRRAGSGYTVNRDLDGDYWIEG